MRADGCCSSSWPISHCAQAPGLSDGMISVVSPDFIRLRNGSLFRFTEAGNFPARFDQQGNRLCVEQRRIGIWVMKASRRLCIIQIHPQYLILRIIEMFTLTTFNVLSLHYIRVRTKIYFGLCYNYLVIPALKRSYRRTAPSKTCAPFPQSSGLQYSAGLWLTPSLHGTNIL